MKKYYLLYTIGLTLLDGFIVYETVYNFYYSILTMIFLHSLITAVFYCISSYFKEPVLFFYVLILFMPFIGFLIYLLERFISSSGRRDRIIEEYEEYINFIKKMKEIQKTNMEKDINQLSLNDHLTLSDADKKKEVFMELISEGREIKIDILKKALKDKDSEVVHYAASTLNFIEGNYEELIMEGQKQYELTQNKDVLNELIKVVEEYIGSGLIEGGVAVKYEKIYIKLLDELMKIEKNEDYRNKLKKGNAFISIKEYGQAERLFKEMLENNVNRFGVYFGLMHVYYETKRYEEIYKVVEELKNKNIRIPQEYKKNIVMWANGDNNE